MSLSKEIRETVRVRADSRCEYCRMSNDWEPYYPYHVEHIIAKQHGGKDELENLAFACRRCNAHKGTNLTGLDPDSTSVANVFHPRQQKWWDHFQLHGHHILGLTAVGRTTVFLLRMNEPQRVKLRVCNLAEWDA